MEWWDLKSVSGSKRATLGGINSCQICDCRRYLNLTIPSQGQTIDVSILDTVLTALIKQSKTNVWAQKPVV